MRWAWVGPSRELVDLVVSLREMRANKGFKQKRHDLHFYKTGFVADGGGQNKRETEEGKKSQLGGS